MMNLENWIYYNTEDDQARFVLGEKGVKTLVCFGVNPSTASPGKLDNTLKSVKRFSQEMGYDGWMMLNLYPQRATNPNDLDVEMKKSYHEENLQRIEQIFLEAKCYDIWAAWGTLIEKRSYLSECLLGIYSLLMKYNVKYYSIGKKTKKGHPHHPLYLSRNLKMDNFDIVDYIKRIQ